MIVMTCSGIFEDSMMSGIPVAVLGYSMSKY
jgi:hypothetical protein